MAFTASEMVWLPSNSAIKPRFISEVNALLVLERV